MDYRDFSLENIVETFELGVRYDRLFPDVLPSPPSTWLQETLLTTRKLARLSGTEKARSEFIIVPILVEIERQYEEHLCLYSGKNLDGDRDRGLNGECDFLWSKGPPAPIITAPIFAIIEAKKEDFELGSAQCAAQLVGAKIFNEKRGSPIEPIFGCVTTGDSWLFLKLMRGEIIFDLDFYSLDRLEIILGILQAIVKHYL